MLSPLDIFQGIQELNALKPSRNDVSWDVVRAYLEDYLSEPIDNRELSEELDYLLYAGVIKGDDNTNLRDTALGLWGDSKVALVFGTWKVAKPQKTRQTLVWDKTPCGFMGDLAIPFGTAHEEIYCLGKDGWTGTREASIIKAQMLMSNDADRPNHPTPKPVGLMERLLDKTLGTVADPFAGSGATLIAARNLGRQVIGVELEEKYCELIAKRASQSAFDFSNL